MNFHTHYFFLDNEIIIHKLLEAVNLAKVSYVNSSKTFYVDLNFILTTPCSAESSLSLAVLGGA